MSRETLPPPSRRRLTRTNYRRMAEVGILAPDARVELIDGEIIDVVPVGPEHAGLVNWLNARLNRLVGERAIVSVRNPFAISKHSEPGPDVLPLRARADSYARAAPEPADVLLLVEVDGTLDLPGLPGRALDLSSAPL